MKATMSRDGTLRITVRTDHRLSRIDLADWICQEYGWYEDDERPLLTKTEVLKAVRSSLAEKGVSGNWDWDQNMPDEEKEAMQTWAEAEVDRLFATEFEGVLPW